MNGYIAMFNEKRVEIRASSLWEAVQEARNRLRVPKAKQGLLSVTLVERGDGSQVTTTVTS